MAQTLYQKECLQTIGLSDVFDICIIMFQEEFTSVYLNTSQHMYGDTKFYN
jgi:hypothetical protein